MVYSFPYILLIAFYCAMALLYHVSVIPKHRIINIMLCAGVTLFFFGFRGFIFYDWISYYPMFKLCDITNVANNDFLLIEPGFHALLFICKFLSGSYSFFVFICSLINTILFMRFIVKRIENIPLGIMVYTVFGGLFLMTDLMRNAIAILIFANAIDYISERKPLKYYLACIAALSFHYSAIFYFPAYFFLHRRINKNLFAAVFFVGCIIYALQIPVFTDSITIFLRFVNPELEEKVRFYLLETVNKAPGIDFVFFERIITAVLILCYTDKLRALRKDADIYINSLLIFFIISFYMHEFVTMSMRMSLLFVYGYWVIWTDLPKCFSISNNRKLFITFMIMYCMLRMFVLTRTILADYDNVLFGTERFQTRESIFNKNYKDL